MADIGSSLPLSALVVGGGVGGLLSAHVACRHFQEVTLLDADRLAPAESSAEGAEGILENARHHRGIPQYAHPHILAMGGLRAMDQLLPGFQDELVRRGGVPMDLGRDLRVYDYGGTFARCNKSSLEVVGCSRNLVQTTLQDEVLSRNAGRLRVRDGCRVSGLHWSSDKASVLGVELEGGEVVKADVVIFASGRFCRLPQWLAAAGHAVPPVSKVDARMTYSTCMYRMPWDWDNRWLGHATYERPNGLRGAGLVPAEGGMWQIFLWGANGVVPPLDDEGYLQYLESLPDAEMYRAIRQAEPLTQPRKYGGTINILRGWHQVPMPPGLLVIGDCVQAVNPVYGQGMSVASQSTVALNNAFSAALTKAGGSVEAQRAAVRSMGPAWQRQLASVIKPAWDMATQNDLGYPDTKAEGVSCPPRLVTAYMECLMRACQQDSKVMEILWEVGHMAARQALWRVVEALAALLPNNRMAAKHVE